MKNKLIIILVMVFFSSCKESIGALFDNAAIFSKERKFEKAIKLYSDIIKRNNKIQLAFYNRGICYVNLKNYPKALFDFNQVMSLQSYGNYIMTYNKDMPHATDEVRAQVPYYDALYEAAQVKFYMDSLKSSYRDFEVLIENNFQEKSNCLLWQGTIWVTNNKIEKACGFFNKAKEVALDDNDKKEADKMISKYCATVKQ